MSGATPRFAWAVNVALVLLFVAMPGFAADLKFDGGAISLDHGSGLSGPVRIVLLLTALSVAPALLIAATSFTRIIIVLSMLRQAIGMTNTPPNMVLISLALFLTLFTMAPVFNAVDSAAVEPYLAGKLDEQAALKAAEAPVRQFLLAQTRESDLKLVAHLSGKAEAASVDELGVFTIIPAFMLSELRIGFEIGFGIFLPFVLIDLIVASVLMSLGMIMVPPLAISLPLKILVFILIDGWSLVTEVLVRSIQT